MQKFIGLVLLFAFSAGVALADMPSQYEKPKAGPYLVPFSARAHVDATTSANVPGTSAGATMHGDADTHPMMVQGGQRSASSTDMHPNFKKFVQAAFLLKHGVPGLVTSVSSNSFTMTVPGGKDHATSTVTVNVFSSTKYLHASTTATYSDITPGSRVEVLGKLSSDSSSIAAQRVVIGAKMGPIPEGKKKLLERVKDFFTGKHASTTNAMINARGSAAAGMEGGFLGHLLHSIFG